MDDELKALGVDDRHERGCVRRYGATETGLPDADEQAARCACHIYRDTPLLVSPSDEALEAIATELARLDLVNEFNKGMK